MSEKLLELLDKQGRAFESFKRANNDRLAAMEARGKADPLLEERVDKNNAEISMLQREIDTLIKKMNRKAFSGGGDFSDDTEEKKAFDTYFRKGVVDDLRSIKESKAMYTESDPDGGFAVPEQVDNEVTVFLENNSPVRRLARKKKSYTSDYKIVRNQGGTTAGRVGEREDRPATDTPKLVVITAPMAEYYAFPLATQIMLDDSGFDVEAFLFDEVQEKFSEMEGEDFIIGNGVDRPKGILSYETIDNASYEFGKVGYVPSGAASTFTNPDTLIDLQHALKRAYRNGAVFLMSDTTQAHVRKFKDGEGNYLWRPGLEPGAANTLLGKAVEVDDNMPSIGAGEFPIAFGNLQRAYVVVDRTPIRVLRDAYTQKPYVGFYTTKRVGGMMVDKAAIKLMKVASS
ncbi:MAG: phage major capsid protein [Desulfobulbaceae bacterium]|nr:phage major capsid protein [Desulfobulbaceae bacterium]